MTLVCLSSGRYISFSLNIRKLPLVLLRSVKYRSVCTLDVCFLYIFSVVTDDIVMSLQSEHEDLRRVSKVSTSGTRRGSRPEQWFDVNVSCRILVFRP